MCEKCHKGQEFKFLAASYYGSAFGQALSIYARLGSGPAKDKAFAEMERLKSELGEIFAHGSKPEHGHTDRRAKQGGPAV